MSQSTLLQTAIYEDLRDRLFAGEVTAGERVSEYQLAEDFQASRMPVRQALARLAHEGLIEQSSRVRSSIINPTLADLQESVELRSLLEPHAVELATARLSWVDYEQLEESHARMASVAASISKKKSFGKDDRKAELHADLMFHRVIWKAADRPRLAKMCDDLHLIWRIGSPLTKDHRAVAAAIKEAACFHRNVLDAMKQGNAKAAAKHMREHIESNRTILAAIARMEDHQ